MSITSLQDIDQVMMCMSFRPSFHISIWVAIMALFEKLVIGEGAIASFAPPLTARDLYIKASYDLELKMYSYKHFTKSLIQLVVILSSCALSFI